MKCLLCNLQFTRENVLKKHYVDYHLVNEDDIHFRELIKPDIIDRKCRICCVNFDNARIKKKHMFLYHYDTEQQIGGKSPRVSNLPINIKKRGPTTYYTINFDQHKNFHDFFTSDTVETFLSSVYQVFRPNKEKKNQGYAEIVNQQKGEIVSENKRVWLTNVYRFKYFNDFVKGEIKDEITKRVVVNGESGSSWFFKRFDRLTIIVSDVAPINLITG